MKLKEKKEQQEKEDLARSLTIKQRLLNRLRFRTIPVSFEDKDGEFTIEIQLLSPADQKKLFGIQQQLSRLTARIVKADTPKKQKDIQTKLEKLDDESCAFLGKICVDPELDKEFWKLGEGYSADVPAKLIKEAMRLSSAGEEDIHFLRGKAKAKASSNS